MMHPHTRLAHLGESLGFGVVATERIPAGTIVWVMDPLDQRIPRERARALGPLYRRLLRTYAFWESDGDLILCWDHGRYVNHSCESNCLGGGFTFEVAVRDIEPGEELTDDYGTFGFAEDITCACGTPSCRGTLRRTDRAAMAPIWDARLVAALAHFGAVEQPLWPLVADKEVLQRALADPGQTPGHRFARAG